MKQMMSCVWLLFLLVLLTACGGKSDTADKSAPAEPESVPEAASPSEPERTWFERSGLSFTPVGEFAFSTSFDETQDPEKAVGTYALDATDNGDGTKTLRATIEIHAQRVDGNFRAGWFNYGFVDQFTGTSVLCKTTAPKTFAIDWHGRTYPLTLQMTDARNVWIEDDEVKAETYRELSVTCPIDYDGAAFFVCGSSREVEEYLVYNSTKPFELLGHGDYDVLIFDANLNPETAGESEKQSQPQETEGAVALDEDSLTVAVKDSRSAAITLSGLSLRDSYLTNMSGSKENVAEYSWSVEIRGNQSSYEVSTHSFAFKPGAEIEKKLSDMQHSLGISDGHSWTFIGDVDMSYTSESITWTFTVPEEYPFDFADVTSYEVRIQDISRDLSVSRTYTV